VDLQWDLRDGQLTLVWTETGGPVIAKPKTKGFGTKIIEASLNMRQGDGAHFDWRPEGLRCTIVVSVVARSDESAEPVRRTEAREPQERQRHILVVEDEALVGMLTSELVGDMGLVVLGPCASLDAAMTLARSHHIDGAILDVNLDGEPVFPLARMLADRAVPMIFLTGYDKSAVEQEFKMFPMLQKPVPAGELSKALSAILGLSPDDLPVKATMA